MQIASANLDVVRVGKSRSSQPSRVTVPARGHPLAKLLFAELRRQGVTYDELEARANVLKCTIKAYRGESTPGLTTIEACLGALGWRLVPVPKLDNMTSEAREALEAAGQHFASDDEAIGALFLALAESPEYASRHVATMAAARRGIRKAPNS